MNAGGAPPPLEARDRVEAALASGAHLWLGYSGGRDSLALLLALRRAYPGRVRAVHVNHGLQAAAGEWEQHCRRSCTALAVPLEVVTVSIRAADPAGPEAAARAARYAAFDRLLAAGDVLALAHHRRDQAETVLLRLLRGAGPAGLAAMRSWRARAHYHLWRPWLRQPREHIESFLREAGLPWVEDPHNADSRYARAALRRQLWPALVRTWPQAEAAIARAARLAAEADELLDELARIDLAACAHGSQVSVAALLALSPSRRRNALRGWLRRHGLVSPSEAAWARIEREVLAAAADAEPRLRVASAELRRYRDALFLLPPLPPAPGHWRMPWRQDRLQLPAGCGTLECRDAARLSLEVGFALGGERLRPRGYAHTRRLKNLFHEAATPPWVRRRTPLLWQRGELVAVGDRWLREDFAAQLESAAAELHWHMPAMLHGLSPR